MLLGSSCTAFSPGPLLDWNVVSTRHRTDTTNRIRRSNNPRRSPTEQLRSNPNDDDDDAIGAEKNGIGGAIGGDLVSALARLDKEWRLSYNSKDDDGNKRNRNDWQVVNVANENGNDKDNNNNDGAASSTSEIVYLLEPSSGAMPSCIIFFLGGAVLGKFPHIAYSTFCKKLSATLDASIVAVPYEVGLDHFDIARRASSLMKNTVILCEDGKRGYPSNLPKYAIGHSLGAKLHSIGIAATGIGTELSGVGFVSYNNFGFAETITMARSFVKEMQVGGGRVGSSSSSSSATPFDALFDLAGMAVSAVGIEFTPSPNDMDKILTTKFDEEVLKKIRMFCFDNDDLDSTKRFLSCFNDKRGSGAVSRPTVTYLPGTHLTPVYLRLGLDDILLDDATRGVANQVTGGFQNVSFGSEENLDTLVKEVSNWMLGNDPNARVVKQFEASIIDAEVER
jgi:hypothetical protein